MSRKGLSLFFTSFVLFAVGLCPFAMADGPTAGQSQAEGQARPDQAKGVQAEDQSGDPLKRPVEEKRRRENAKALKHELSEDDKKWLNQDVRWIITDEERKAFMQLSNEEEREQFIEAFWDRRNPNPDSEDNEFKDEHYRRIEYANEHFQAGMPGWMTDRGRIYIVFGPPDEIESHPSGGSYQRPQEEGGGETSTFPFEQWRYRYIEGIGQEIILEFVDDCQCGAYEMTMDRSKKDALLHTPGGGLTQYEEMGLSNKTARFTGNPEHLGAGPDTARQQSQQFDRLEQFYKVNQAPPVKFKDSGGASRPSHHLQPHAF